MHGWRLILCLIVSGVCLCGALRATAANAAGQGIVVFAAASTTNAVNELGKIYEAKGLGHITASFASSSTLAKQIEQGAPADVFLSANTEWMDYLQEKNLLVKDSRTDLLRNRIVLIVPKDSKVTAIDIKPGFSLLPFLSANGDANGRLAVGDPAHVPVGMYGRKALEKLGAWDAVKDRLAPAKDVRAGLALVERAEAPVGLVYASDVAASGKVRVVGEFPAGSHPDVVYPVAAIANGPAAVGANGKADAAKAFIAFLSTSEAKAVFEKYGFAGM